MRGIKELLNITSARDRTRMIICSAIRNRRVIEFFYHGGYRTVEPFCLGLVISGGYENVSLLCYQVGGYSELREVVEWKLYRAAEMEDIEILNEEFTGDRPGYDPDSVEMAKIYCCVTPVAGAPEPPAEPIAAMPRYEPVVEAAPVIEPLPPLDIEDFLLPETPEPVYRPLTHNELMRLFRFTHPVVTSNMYLVVYSGPFIKPRPEYSDWELRHFAPIFRLRQQEKDRPAASLEAGEAPAAYVKPLTHNEIMRIFRLAHPLPVPGMYLMVLLPSPAGKSPSERTRWESAHFARLLKGFHPIGQTA